MATVRRTPAQSKDKTADRLLQRGLTSAAVVYDELARELVTRLSRAKRQGMSLNWLLSLAEDIIRDYAGPLADVLADAHIAGFLGGAGRVAKQARPLLLSGGSRPPSTPPPSVLGTDDGFSFDGYRAWLPLIENAVEHLQELGVFRREDYRQLSDTERRNAFTLAGEHTLEAISHVHDALTESVEEGTGLPEFKEAVEEAVGTSAVGPGRLENTFRTGQARAYSAGMDKIVSHPIIAAGLPYVMALPIRDARLTSLCDEISEAGIGGSAVFRVDDPVWKRYANPRHFSCRCGRRYMTLGEAAEHGIEEAQKQIESGLPPPYPAWVPEPRLSEEARKTFAAFRGVA